MSLARTNMTVAAQRVRQDRAVSKKISIIVLLLDANGHISQNYMARADR